MSKRNFIKKIKDFFRKTENVLLLFFSLTLGLVTFFFIARRVMSLYNFKIMTDAYVFYFLYYTFTLLTIGTITYFSKHWLLMANVKKIFFVFSPTAVILFYGLQKTRMFNPLLYIIVGIYTILIGLYIISQNRFQWFPNKKSQAIKKNWFRSSRLICIVAIAIVLVLNFGFGIYNIGKFAAVDEPLWVYERIPSFWKNLGEMDWYSTRVSDKPGLTVAVISGIGLLWENPKMMKSMEDQPKSIDWPAKMERFNVSFRTPIFIFVFLSLPFFYFLVSKLLGKNVALFSFIFVGLSPIIVGMARIINPDSILWIFTSFSLLGYLLYLRERKHKYLYLSAILLGLALLTKYISNILYIFFFFLIFSEYFFNQAKYQDISLSKYIKKSLIDYFSLVFVSLAIIFILYPAVWPKIDRLLLATIWSEAFISTWKIFVWSIILVAADAIFNQAKLTDIIISSLLKRKRHIVNFFYIVFIVAAGYVFIDSVLGMFQLDIESIVSSPKSAYLKTGISGLFLANFYPLIFGIIPAAFILLFAVIFLLLKTKNSEKSYEHQFIFYTVVFVIIYYTASSVNNVVSMIRYQIILYPLVLIISGIGAAKIYGYFKRKSGYQCAFVFTLVFIASYSLFTSAPFFSSYSSALLPNKYHIDLKDMGAGSFEAAEFLNSLPNPEKIVIWTDKKGVCSFFVGKCYTSFVVSEIKDVHFDYVVVSSSRENRTSVIVQTRFKKISDESKKFDIYYHKNDGLVYEKIINGRPSQFVKVFKI